MSSLAAILPAFLPRPFLGLGDATHSPFSLTVETDRLTLSWYPATRDRALWAGQTNHLGLRYNVYTYDGGNLSIPTWYLALAATLLALLTWLLPRRRALPPNHCPHCGYDIRATPDRCPECGKTPERRRLLRPLPQHHPPLNPNPVRARDAPRATGLNPKNPRNSLENHDFT